MTAPLLMRLGAHDRELRMRYAIGPAAPARLLPYRYKPYSLP
jgi:hypothetical protein